MDDEAAGTGGGGCARGGLSLFGLPAVATLMALFGLICAWSMDVRCAYRYEDTGHKSFACDAVGNFGHTGGLMWLLIFGPPVVSCIYYAGTSRQRRSVALATIIVASLIFFAVIQLAV